MPSCLFFAVPQDGDLDNYITIMGQIVSSIDRILEKSRFVVGNIDFNEE